MVKSMTGFGRYECVTEEYKITVEIKSVNHRYCDLSIKLPKKFNAVENNIRNVLKKYAARGKIDVYVGYEDYAQQQSHVRYHSNIAQGYVEAAGQAAAEFSVESALTAAALIRFPEVVTLEEDQADIMAIYPALEETVKKAAAQFAQARETEGEQLYRDITEKLSYVLELVKYVEERSPEILAEYRQKIYDKVQEFLGDRKVDESVLATELIIYADKVCVDEETVRLKSHVENMGKTLERGEPVGRKLDFIAQEMNREANTILSKANDRKLSETAINLKTEIEKIREQVQNIE